MKLKKVQKVFSYHGKYKAGMDCPEEHIPVKFGGKLEDGKPGSKKTDVASNEKLDIKNKPKF